MFPEKRRRRARRKLADNRKIKVLGRQVRKLAALCWLVDQLEKEEACKLG